MLHSSAVSTASPAVAADVVVYGETLAGISAAIQAARLGRSVVLLAQSNHLGGVATAGLTATDMNRSASIGGIAREFYGHIYDHYLQPSAWRGDEREKFFERAKTRTYAGKDDALRMQWVYESHVAEEILADMLQDAGVIVVRQCLIAENADAVEMTNGRILALRTTSGERHGGLTFIDASYEGDLMARAGVSHVIGREGNAAFGETMNGIHPAGFVGISRRSIDPWVRPGDPSSGLLPFIERGLWGRPGDQDNRSQAYCYRVTITDDPANRLPLVKPANFDPLWHEALVRRLQLNPDAPLHTIISLAPMPNHKADTNGLDFIGGNYAYPAATHRERARIAEMHRDYALGMLWTLAHDERIPASIREEMMPWGLPMDEFTDHGNFPHQLYVREARRMRGGFVMKEENVRREARADADHGVAIGSYALDSHVVSRVLDADGQVLNEGSRLESRFRGLPLYPISYHALVPQAKECRNLLVPVCLSATHVAYASIRMEPVFMVLGQAAGAAAALSIESRVAVQDVSYPRLRSVLISAGQILDHPSIQAVPPLAPAPAVLP
ncbi:MAG: FAD-dependent oxidoreductase [Planctomycetia bacterium]|nr:FAD-dependent oxidoreductase [Planctomycetia bacterium]